MRSPNRLLDLLLDEDYFALAPVLELVDLPQGLDLSKPYQVDDGCYFPFSGIGSTVAVSPDGKQSEVGLFGREGMSPSSLVLGVDRNPYRVVMQIGGDGAFVPRAAFVKAIQARPFLRDLLLRWAHVSSIQVGYTALSNASHQIEQRLARWLLMCHDRTSGDELPLTHHFLSIMLAVRRPSVTTALHILEGRGLIRARRGLIVIRDRSQLEAAASDAYGVTEQEYDRLISRYEVVAIA